MRGLARFVAVGLLMAGTVLAQDADVTSARAIAAEGIRAFDAGYYDYAQKKLGLAYEVVQVPTIALYRARALVEVGRLVEASELYLVCARLEIEAGQLEKQQQAQEQCTQEREALQGRISTLVVQVIGVEGIVRFEIDGRPVNGALLREGHLVDPGLHKVRGVGDGREATAVVALEPGATRTIALDLSPPPPPLPAPVAVKPAPAPRATAEMEEPAHSDRVGRTDRAQRTLGFVSVGVAGGLLMFGAVNGVRAKNKKTDLDASGCAENQCLPEQQREVDAYNRALGMANGSFIAAGLFGAAGTVLILTAPRNTRTSRRRLDPWVAPGNTGLRLRF